MEVIISESENIDLKEKFTNEVPSLDNTLTIHTLYESYFYDYDSESITANGKEYEVTAGDFQSFINELDLEWETDKEYMSEE